MSDNESSNGFHMEEPTRVIAPPLPSTMRKVEMPADKEFRIAGTSSVQDVAWSIVKALEEGYRPILVAIGVQAVTQAVKSIAVANSRVASQGKIFTALPAFENVKIPDPETKKEVERTLMKLVLCAYKF